MKKIDELQKEYDLATVKANEEMEQNKKRIFDAIQSLTEKRLIIYSSFSSTFDNHYLEARNKIGITVYFAIDDNSDKLNSSSSLFITYGQRYNYEKGEYEGPDLAMSCGSSGILVTRVEDPYKVECCHLMSRIWEHEHEFVDLLKNLKHTNADLALQAWRALEDEKTRLKHEENSKLAAEAESMIKVGAVFNETTYEAKYNYGTEDYEKVISCKTTYTITKLTDRRAYIEYTTKAINCCDTVYTGYVSIDRLKRHIIDTQIKKNADYYERIGDCCSGIAQVSILE